MNCSLPQGIKFITPGCLYNSLDYGLLTAAAMAVIITATPQEEANVHLGVMNY